ncbi:hypothetical protein HAX54_035896, partial [Datura stramonium]|nr:hypothetical protein [Datura stramonium]
AMKMTPLDHADSKKVNYSRASMIRSKALEWVLTRFLRADNLRVSEAYDRRRTADRPTARQSSGKCRLVRINGERRKKEKRFLCWLFVVFQRRSVGGEKHRKSEREVRSACSWWFGGFPAQQWPDLMEKK